MSIPARDLLMEVSKLTELQNVRVTIKESFKGAALAGVSTLIGGLLLGPIGLAIGGTIGGCSAALVANNNFRSVPYIITHDLTSKQQKDLIVAIGRCLNSIPIIDAANFVRNVACDPTLATTVAMAVISFLNSQPGMEVVD